MDYRDINQNRRIANEQLYIEVAEELNIPGITSATVKEIVEAQSEFLFDTIRTGGLDNVIFPYLGKFKVNPRKLQAVINKQQKGGR